MSNNYVLEIKTVQIAPMRTLMTALKDILLELGIVLNGVYRENLFDAGLYDFIE